MTRFALERKTVKILRRIFRRGVGFYLDVFEKNVGNNSRLSWINSPFNLKTRTLNELEIYRNLEDGGLPTGQMLVKNHSTAVSDSFVQTGKKSPQCLL